MAEEPRRPWLSDSESVPEPATEVPRGIGDCKAGLDMSELETELSDENFEACLDDIEGLVDEERSEPDEGSGGKCTMPVLEKSSGCEACVG